MGVSGQTFKKKPTSAIFPLALLATLSPTKPHWFAFPSTVLLRQVEPSRAEPHRPRTCWCSRGCCQAGCCYLSTIANPQQPTSYTPSNRDSTHVCTGNLRVSLCVQLTVLFSEDLFSFSHPVYSFKHLLCFTVRVVLAAAGENTFPENAASQLKLLNVQITGGLYFEENVNVCESVVTLQYYCGDWDKHNFKQAAQVGWKCKTLPLAQVKLSRAMPADVNFCGELPIKTCPSSDLPETVVPNNIPNISNI